MKPENTFNINVNTSDIILTPFSCASIVNEILKGILYQKCQIPYPYNWMKSVVTKKRQKIEPEIKERPNFKAENHFRLVSNALDTLETVMTTITNEFVSNKRSLKKVVIVLGTTPYTAHEVFTIVVKSLAEGHTERNHVAQLNKYQQKILRSIFLSQEWLDKIDASISCTNIYIYLVKDVNDSNDNSSSDPSVFLPSAPLSFASKTKQIQISLCSEMTADTNCCENLAVFEDFTDNSNIVSNSSDDEEYVKDLSWYKYKDLVKGFKDCFINKESVSELW